MMEVHCGMMNKGDDAPAKCRERRRQRMQMRRLAGSSRGHVAREDVNGFRKEGKRFRAAAAMQVSSSSGEDADEPEQESAADSEAIHDPVFGTMSVSGRSRKMEDAIDVQARLCLPEICQRRPMHFFGVFDGHGGAHVSALCAMKMHVLLKEELMRVGNRGEGECSSGVYQTDLNEADLRDEWTEVMNRTFQRTHEVAVNTCACGSVSSQCICHPVDVSPTGSTAVVAALTSDHIVMANCGDSRAVLSRGGRAVPLSKDDNYLKLPFVCWELDVTVVRRDWSADECLVLASGGLWDVLSNELACEVACKCLREVHPTDLDSSHQDEGNAVYPCGATLAAALLTRLALGRKSLDNISVIVIDLQKS